MAYRIYHLGRITATNAASLRRKATLTVISTVATMSIVAMMCMSTPLAHAGAAGGGVYDVLPGVPSQFQVSAASVQCKVSEKIFLPQDFELPNGFVIPFDLFFQMFMFSTDITSSEVDGNTVIIEGFMTSKTVLQPVSGGEPIRLIETGISFMAVGEDNAPADANDGFPDSDTFTLSLEYTEEPGNLDQADLFASADGTTTFSGFIRAGNVDVW